MTKAEAIEEIEGQEATATSSRRQERLERRAARDTGAGRWVAGLLLVGLGALFLLQQAGYLTSFSNWWALFILLPAIGSFSAAWAAYNRNGGAWTNEAVAPLLAGLLFLGLTIVFLFDLNLSLFGPLLLIAGGLLLLLSPMLGRRSG